MSHRTVGTHARLLSWIAILTMSIVSLRKTKVLFLRRPLCVTSWGPRPWDASTATARSSLRQRAKLLRIIHDTSTPNRPETNGVAERAVRRVCEGTRAVLLQSGLPHRWWAEAAKCYCVLRNVSEPATSTDATTPYQLRHKTNFKGKIIPFGALIQYKPSSKRETELLSKFGSKMLPAIFVGYHLHSGGRWSGDYLVIDAAAYQKRLDGSRIPVHRVKELHYSGPAKFPVKDGTIESLPEEVAEAANALGETPSIIEQSLPGKWDHILSDTPPVGTQAEPHSDLRWNAGGFLCYL